jgi:hypothetical protein
MKIFPVRVAVIQGHRRSEERTWQGQLRLVTLRTRIKSVILFSVTNKLPLRAEASKFSGKALVFHKLAPPFLRQKTVSIMGLKLKQLVG